MITNTFHFDWAAMLCYIMIRPSLDSDSTALLPFDNQRNHWAAALWPK